ncbi:MAG: hypothetical protein KDK37_19380, partial [Leptospiraceae bacterium]|nr:hypothetical protein [Leptospiraceae bacterium]
FLYVPGAMPQDVLDDLQVQWENMFSNNQNNHRFPILTADAPDLKWTSLNSMTEMAFEKLMQWVTTFTLAAHGMDQAELGLRLMGSQTFSEGSMDGRINSAMTRAKKALLAYFSDVCNDIKETVDQFNPTLFTFKGVEVDDEDKKLDRDQKLVKSIEFQDEVRVRRGMPTMGESLAKIYNLPPEDAEKVKFAGAFVLEPTWNQTGAQIVSQVSGGDGAQGGEQTDLFDDYSPDEEDTQENWDS